MTVTGTTASPASFAGSESGAKVTLNPGSYSVSESGPGGYTASYSADCSGSIGAGQSKTCTVTNNDNAATLLVKKHVVNDNGGSKQAGDFTMTVDGNTPSRPHFPGH